MQLNPNRPEPIASPVTAPRPRYWPGQDFGVRAPLPGETALSDAEWRVAFRNGLLRVPNSSRRQDAC